ncbi:TPA: hypothetical protein JIY88_06545 [Acinetobacter nosocomialis]|nr:hypothetical protein FRD49_13415 [Acinetobacter nosocomialis]HAV4996689.1 hypothetical protein [Acinetobacter nosocomialis]
MNKIYKVIWNASKVRHVKGWWLGAKIISLLQIVLRLMDVQRAFYLLLIALMQVQFSKV